MKKRLLFLLVLFFSYIVVENVYAEVEKEHFLLILVPEFSFEEVEWLLNEGEEIEIWDKGSLAGVNIRPDGAYSYINSVVSLSSGSRGTGIKDWNAFMKGEYFNERLVDEVYLQWTGDYPQTDIIHPLFHKLREKNHLTTYGAEIGLVGEHLKEYGVAPFVMGNSDLSTEKVRYGSLFTIDTQGNTLGQLQEGVRDNTHAPMGVEMNEQVIIDTLLAVEGENDSSFFVLEWGDFHRLYQEKENMTEGQFQTQYKERLLHLENFLSEVVTSSRTVLFLSPMMNQQAYQQKKRLAPIWIWDNRYEGERTFLTSNTTRQSSVVSNVDVAPFILSYFGITTPLEMIGQPIVHESSPTYSQTEIVEQMDWIFTIFRTRGIVLPSYITLLVILLVGTSLFIWRNKSSERWKGVARILLVAAISSPIWLLVTPHLLKYIQVGAYFWVMTLASLITGYLFVRYLKTPLTYLGAFTFLLITIDLMNGSYFMQRSYLGYDPIIGARYYGIGNEYAGVFIVSGILMLLPILRQKNVWIKRVVIIVWTFVTLLLLGSSQLGTNAGATLAAGITGGFMLYRTFANKKLFFLMILGGTTLVALIGFLFLLQVTGKMTHIGYAFERIFSGDFYYAFDVIKRKLAMNWKIFKYSNWTQLFVTSYILVGFVLWMQKRIVTKTAEKNVLQGSIVASVALLLLNDSGVVAAATSMFLIVAASYYWMIEKKAESHQT
ncbi:hypothetical protein [Bacillus sp. FJAT-45350]|uniref:hypothetical protein n=1 Tax=Bacillus sp. FJAT-45350 TaxID=2011014 RepID=UPI000BB7F095|nr:hypothetical protein [Bacillus sp. FJAT-45350]